MTHTPAPRCTECGKIATDQDIDGAWWPPCEHAKAIGLHTLAYATPPNAPTADPLTLLRNKFRCEIAPDGDYHKCGHAWHAPMFTIEETDSILAALLAARQGAIPLSADEIAALRYCVKIAEHCVRVHATNATYAEAMHNLALSYDVLALAALAATPGADARVILTCKHCGFNAGDRAIFETHWQTNHAAATQEET